VPEHQVDVVRSANWPAGRCGTRCATAASTGGAPPCRVASDHPDAAVFDSVRHLLHRYEKHAAEGCTGNEHALGRDLIAAAAVVARTPGPPLPAGRPDVTSRSHVVAGSVRSRGVKGASTGTPTHGFAQRD
jgi:hypothetical protein